MTPAQQARLTGFNASLQQRGVALLTPAGKEFKALVQYMPSGMDTFELGPAQRTEGVLAVLRDTFAPLSITEKTRLTEKESQRRWVVASIENHPANIAVLLHSNLEP